VCKKSIKNSPPFVKKTKKMSGPSGGGIFLTHTEDIVVVLEVQHRWDVVGWKLPVNHAEIFQSEVS